MLRAAAKNFRSVTVVPSPEFYNEVLAEIEDAGQVSEETRRRLALAAFRQTAAYDARIASWLGTGWRAWVRWTVVRWTVRRKTGCFRSAGWCVTRRCPACATGRTRTRRRLTTRSWG